MDQQMRINLWFIEGDGLKWLLFFVGQVQYSGVSKEYYKVLVESLWMLAEHVGIRGKLTDRQI